MEIPKKKHRDIDGGWAWWVVGAQFLWLFISVGIMKGFGLIFAELLSKLQTTPFQTSWINFFSSITAAVCGAVAGYFSDRISMRPVMVLASIVGAAGMLLFAYSSNLLIAVLGRAVINCASSGIIHSCTLSGISKYFTRKRPIASTMASSGGSLGGLIIPIFIAYFLRHDGFTQTVIFLACAWIQSCVVGVILKPPPLSKCVARVPDDVTMINSSDQEMTPSFKTSESRKPDKYKNLWEDVLDEDNIEGSVDREESDEKNNDWKIVNKIRRSRYSFLGNCQIVMYYLALCLSSTAYFNWFLFLPSYTLENGLTKSETSMCLALASISEGVIRPIIGIFLTKRNCPRDKPLTVSICSIVAGLSTFAVSLYIKPYVIYAYGVVFGSVSGLFLSLSAPMMADHVRPEQLGSMTGLFGVFVASGVGIGSPILGLLVDLMGGFGIVMKAISVLYVIVAGMYLVNFTRAAGKKIPQTTL